ncbi:S26 family signal peptidase [[Flexibacter] sp. ATCC 35208]|uniref:S26 family signal peptidase n=1 Tax=[Flexibacter] sp. ATCC 35208 TaxID=1936242 RepID=UPI0009D447BD|nr:S26 family signal peptidase [[Flexibacter] sp. ATCC 35208]OMP74641.1 hypothetical protein BW716_34325 [[Flexibacter] sp. ATCC 35208]
MKGTLKVILLLPGIQFVLLLIGRLTDVFQYYKAPTIANKPSIKLNSRMLGSRFISPKRLDFIWFTGDTPFGTLPNIYRLCGLPGDIVEIRKGILFATDKDINKDLKLGHPYIVTRNEFEI